MYMLCHIFFVRKRKLTYSLFIINLIKIKIHIYVYTISFQGVALITYTYIVHIIQVYILAFLYTHIYTL